MGLNIKQAIFSRGLEVREVAARMGITPIGLSKHINGNPSVDVLKRIADAIGCNVVDLFDEEKTVASSSASFVCPKCGTRLTVKEEK